jgi:hypothetical protein
MNREDCLSSFSLSLGLLQLPRVRPHCCHVRLPRPRPGHTLSLRRGGHLGQVGPAKLEADLAEGMGAEISPSTGVESTSRLHARRGLSTGPGRDSVHEVAMHWP